MKLCYLFCSPKQTANPWVFEPQVSEEKKEKKKKEYLMEERGILLNNLL
jgi:hypothetical protein